MIHTIRTNATQAELNDVALANIEALAIPECNYYITTCDGEGSVYCPPKNSGARSVTTSEIC